jgi:hypothetical protein
VDDEEKDKELFFFIGHRCKMSSFGGIGCRVKKRASSSVLLPGALSLLDSRANRWSLELEGTSCTVIASDTSDGYVVSSNSWMWLYVRGPSNSKFPPSKNFP